MSEKMTLLAVKDYGHILGVVTRTDEQAGDPEIGDVVGEGYVFWDSIRREKALSIPAADLEVVTVDLANPVLLDPQGHGLDDGKPAALQEAKSIVVVADKITVDLGAKVSEPVEVQVRIDEQIPITGKVQVDAQTVEILKDTGPGDHDVLMLAAGYRPILQQDTV